jgi:hypothetical protein
MKKILLIYEDYKELSDTELVLKKIGFDTVGITNEVLFSDQLLQFNPDIVVANGKSTKVSTLSIGTKLRKNTRFLGKVLLIFPQGVKPEPADIKNLRMDGILEAPYKVERLIETLAKFSALNLSELMDKYRRAMGLEPVYPEKKVYDTAVVTKDEQRIKKYDKLISAIKFDTSKTTFSKADVKTRQKTLTEDWDFEELERLDDLKRKFANALFKK